MITILSQAQQPQLNLIGAAVVKNDEKNIAYTWID